MRGASLILLITMKNVNDCGSERVSNAPVVFQSLFWVRLLSHLICGLLIGSIYFDIGNDAAKVINNSSCLIFAVLFLMFTAMMPTITTCK